MQSATTRSRELYTGLGTSRKTCAQAEALGEVLAEALDAEGLGGVVAGGDEVQARLARLRHHALGGLAGEERVRAGGGGLGEVVGAGARDDRHARTRAGPASNTSGSRAVIARDAREQLACSAVPRREASRGSRSARRVQRERLELARRRARGRAARCCRARGGRRAGGGRRRGAMSASNRIFRRRLSAASIAPGPGAPEEPVVDDQQLGALGGGQLEQLGAAPRRRWRPCARASGPGTCRPLGQ